MKLLKIGRNPANDIVIYSEKVSSVHAELTLLDNGDMLLEDIGSRNGTFLMNQQLSPNKQVSVKRGDIIRFADVELQWKMIPMPEDNSAYKGIYGIGSHPNNNIPVKGSTVSRFHATVKAGRDGKMYIVDHSKNGTTVGGLKIPSNTPYSIKRKDAIACGGVPVDLSSLPWPKKTKIYVFILVTLLLLGGIALGIWMLNTPQKEEVVGNVEKSDTELFAHYNNSVVMLIGVYHYEITIGNKNLDEINQLLRKNLGKRYHIPKKVLWDERKNIPVDISEMSQKDLAKAYGKKGISTGNGFFVSEDGKLVTTLHVAKPWAFSNEGQYLQDYYTARFSKAVELMNAELGFTSLSGFVSQLKVEGKLDYIILLSQGESYDPDNIIKCNVLSTSEDTNKDVALIQTSSKRLPTSNSAIVNVRDSMDLSDQALAVGEHVYTIGFSADMSYEDVILKGISNAGIQVNGQGGSIIQHTSDYSFGYNVPTSGGAEGSPVFNKYGMLIGVHHQEPKSVETQGYNYGIKAKYVKELLENPYKQ